MDLQPDGNDMRYYETLLAHVNKGLDESIEEKDDLRAQIVLEMGKLNFRNKNYEQALQNFLLSFDFKNKDSTIEKVSEVFYKTQPENFIEWVNKHNKNGYCMIKIKERFEESHKAKFEIYIDEVKHGFGDKIECFQEIDEARVKILKEGIANLKNNNGVNFNKENFDLLLSEYEVFHHFSGDEKDVKDLFIKDVVDFAYYQIQKREIQLLEEFTPGAYDSKA
jgi:hypothetical protein